MLFWNLSLTNCTNLFHYFYTILNKQIKHAFREANRCINALANIRTTLLSNLYITKSWSVAFNATTLMLHHISFHVILFFFSFLKYNLSYNFKMVFIIFSPINVAHNLFIYFHYHHIINPVHYLFIYFHYHHIINLYN